MYEELYDYLILHGQLAMPGLGRLSVERTPAITEFTHKQINPSSYSIAFQSTHITPAKKLFNWLAERLGISYHDAIVRFNGFALDLRNEVLAGNKIVWENVGVFSKDMSGDIKFEPVLVNKSFDRPVAAVRVIREKAVHTVKVGEDERTSVEMTEMLNPPERGRTQWWMPALIAAILLTLILLIYFLQRGWNISSAANQENITPAKASPTYTVPG